MNSGAGIFQVCVLFWVEPFLRPLGGKTIRTKSPNRLDKVTVVCVVALTIIAVSKGTNFFFPSNCTSDVEMAVPFERRGILVVL